MTDGARYERQLKDFFKEQGGAAIRIPASGARTPEELPDILGRMNGEIYACELKYTTTDRTRFDKQEINELLFFANQWDATPVLVSRFAYNRTFWGFEYEDMRSFRQWKEYKSVAFPKEDKEELLVPMEDIVGEDENLK